ncbi:hypothetical protein [Mesorhizobium sp.]|nr:hypothetical protein [Mesorhizobium sp.]
MSKNISFDRHVASSDRQGTLGGQLSQWKSWFWGNAVPADDQTDVTPGS